MISGLIDCPQRIQPDNNGGHLSLVVSGHCCSSTGSAWLAPINWHACGQRADYFSLPQWGNFSFPQRVRTLNCLLNCLYTPGLVFLACAFPINLSVCSPIQLPWLATRATSCNCNFPCGCGWRNARRPLALIRAQHSRWRDDLPLLPCHTIPFDRLHFDISGTSWWALKPRGGTD